MDLWKFLKVNFSSEKRLDWVWWPVIYHDENAVLIMWYNDHSIYFHKVGCSFFMPLGECTCHILYLPCEAWRQSYLSVLTLCLGMRFILYWNMRVQNYHFGSPSNQSTRERAVIVHALSVRHNDAGVPENSCGFKWQNLRWKWMISIFCDEPHWYFYHSQGEESTLEMGNRSGIISIKVVLATASIGWFGLEIEEIQGTVQVSPNQCSEEGRLSLPTGIFLPAGTMNIWLLVDCMTE